MVRSEPLVRAKVPPISRVIPAPVANAREGKLFIALAIAHLPLGILLYMAGPAAILHPVAALLVGVYWALKKRYSLDRVALAGGYIIGSEVLWRMAQVPVPWEIGKIGIAVIMILALVVRRQVAVPALPLIYLIALLPAFVLTLLNFELGTAREIFTSTMGGPLLLFVSCWYFSHVRVTEKRVRAILFSVILPLLSVGCATLFYTVSAENIDFGGESNLATSGGFGPNQVSSMLGLGVLMAAGCIILFRNLSFKLKVILGAIALFLAAQSTLTFSRGGMYNAIGGLSVMMMFQFKSVTEGLRRVVPLAALAILFLLFVFPILDNFTGGKLQERFEDTGTSNRTEIIESDMQVFLQNPIFGVGVGLSRQFRQQMGGMGGVSHTEFSRLLSEHGAFGLIAMITMAAMLVMNFIKQQSIIGRALAAGAAVWSILYMFNAAMRLAAPAFLLGIVFMMTVADIPSRAIKRRRSVRKGPAAKRGISGSANHSDPLAAES